MTSSAVNGVPSWNATFFRRLKRHTVGDVCFQSVASAGTDLQVLVEADERLVDVVEERELQRLVERMRIHRQRIALVREAEGRGFDGHGDGRTDRETAERPSAGLHVRTGVS